MAGMNETPHKANHYAAPDLKGHFGPYGGMFVAETLMPLVLDVEKHYRAAQADEAFKRQFD